MTGPVAASRSISVLAPSDRIMNAKIIAERNPYRRMIDGATSGMRAGPGGSAVIPEPIVT